MTRTVVIVCVGPGLGAPLVRRFAAEGRRVGLFARSRGYIESLAEDLPAAGEGLVVDGSARRRAGSRGLCRRVASGPVDVLFHHASTASWTGLTDTNLAEFERVWLVNGRGTFVCSQETVGDMLETGGGTVVFMGATSAVGGWGGAIGSNVSVCLLTRAWIRSHG